MQTLISIFITELSPFEICCRAEGGAIILEHAFTAKRHAEGHQRTLKSKFHLLEYLAIWLGKIQVQIKKLMLICQSHLVSGLYRLLLLWTAVSIIFFITFNVQIFLTGIE